MITLEFTVKGQLLVMTTDCSGLEPTSDTVNYFRCHFNFNNEWNGLNKLAMFKNVHYNITKSVVPNSDGYCYIPYEVLANTGVILLELVGFISSEGTTINKITTSVIDLFWQKQEGIIDTSGTQKPTATEYEQFVAYVQEYATSAINAKNEAISASNSAQASANSAQSYATQVSGQVSIATDAAVSANSSKVSAQAFASQASGYAINASQSANSASVSASTANSAASAASNSATDAAASAVEAQSTETKIEKMTASASGLSAGSSPTVVKTETTESFNLHFGIPKGDKGDKGDPGRFSSATASVGATVGVPSVVVTYNDTNVDFAFNNLKGVTGDSGVYIGTEAPTNNANVWIDTDGTADGSNTSNTSNNVHLYMHHVSLRDFVGRSWDANGRTEVIFNLYNTNSTSYTLNTLINDLLENHLLQGDTNFLVSGGYIIDGAMRPALGLFKNNNDVCIVFAYGTPYTTQILNSSNFVVSSDKVTQIF